MNCDAFLDAYATRSTHPATMTLYDENGQPMKRFLTTKTLKFQESSVTAKPTATSPEMRLVKAYPDITYQSIVGFGAALTEASGYVFSQMPESTQDRFLELCFGTGGNRYSLCRTSIQSCDFSLVPRSYMKTKDESLRSFSIDDDWAYVLPLVKAAQAKNPAIEFLASPWSPPAWAKTNRTMKRGGHLRRGAYDIWARMIAKTIAAYRAEGVPIGRITIQNETQAWQIWESCLFDGAQEAEFLGSHLKPALKREGLDDVKVLIWDHNKERMLDRAIDVMATHGRAKDVDGVAFHWYSGDHFDAVRATREFIGDGKELIFTEGCDFYSAGSDYWELPHAEHYAHEIIGDLDAGANGIIDWNILLDAQGGPNHVGNFCDAPIMYDQSADELNVRLPFYYIGHFSRFIQPGARRMLVTHFASELETCGFVNPDKSRALVILNRSEDDIAFDLTWGSKLLDTRIASLEAPARSIQTICW